MAKKGKKEYADFIASITSATEDQFEISCLIF